jgi:MFS family permease
MRRYRGLLAIAGVPRLTWAVLLSRVATSMLSLSLLVTTTRLYGYAAAGLLLMVYALGTAVVGPVRGRLADRHEPRTVMLSLLAGHAVAYAGLLVGLLAAAPVPAVAVAAAALGLSVPPAGPVVRGLWPTIVPADGLPTAYAFDAALNTATFLAGPMIAGGLLLVMAPPLVVGATGAVKLCGDALVAIAPTLRRRGPTPAPGDRSFFGPLADGRVRLLLGIILVDTFTFGALEVAAVAAASGQGGAGVFTSALALGGVVSGLAYGARTWPGGARTQLVVLHGGGAAVLAAGALGGWPLVLVAAVFLLYGLVNGPAETLKQMLVGDIAAEGQRIEAFAWVFSVMWAGFGIGTTVAGRLAGDGETGPPLYVAAAAQVVVAVVVVAGLRRPHHRDT